MYLKIENQGEVQPGAFTLLGASTKRGQDDKIGMFGSGNKYALAYLMRNDIKVRIFSGLNEIKLGTSEEKLGDNTFQVITVNGQRTSITTDTGLKWKLWQAIRELYSNAIDEGQASIDEHLDPEPSPKPGFTQIYVEYTAGVYDFYGNLEKYFADGLEEVYSGLGVKFYARTGDELKVYRKGICCHTNKIPSLYDYDLKEVEINESRLVEDRAEMYKKIGQAWYACDNVPMLRRFIEKTSSGSIIEVNILSNYKGTSAELMGDSWLRALNEKYIAPKGAGLILSMMGASKNTQFIHDQLYEDIVARFGDDRVNPKLKGRDSLDKMFYEAELTPLQGATLKAAIGFLDQCELDYPYNDIIGVNFQDTGRKYLTEESTLYISAGVLDGGNQQAVETIITATYKNTCELFGGPDSLMGMFIGYMKQKNAITL